MDKEKEEAAEASEVTECRMKILHLLKLYPRISATMLQAGLGPQIKPDLWRPILGKLIEEGKVEEEQHSQPTHLGRYNTYNFLSLPGTKIHVPED